MEEDTPGLLYDSDNQIVREQYHEINHIEPIRYDSPEATFRGFKLDDLIGKVTALAVNDALPKHWHQMQNHILKPVVEKAEVHELQGLCALDTFGEVKPCPSGHTRIPLM